VVATIPVVRLGSFYFFYFAVLGAMLPYWPLYLESIGLNAGEIAQLAALMMATRVVAPHMWGYLADSSGQRMRIIRSGAGLAALCFAGIFLSQQFFWIAVVVLAYSFFQNAVLPQFEVVTLSCLQGQYERYSHVRAWGSVGFIVAVVALGYLFEFISVATLPWILLASLLAVWVSTWLIKENSGLQAHEDSAVPAWTMLKQPVVLAFLTASFLMQASHGPYYTFFSIFLTDLGYSPTTTGIMWAVGVIAEVVLFWRMAALMQRFSLRALYMGSLVLALLRWACMGFIADNIFLLFLAQCLHAASFGSFHAASIEIIRRLFNKGNQGQGQALYSSISYGLGGAFGALIAGYCWAYSPVFSFLVAAGLCFLAILIVGYWIKQENLL
jgi:PPP family 3-phenylpropionic acid transporter